MLDYITTISNVFMVFVVLSDTQGVAITLTGAMGGAFLVPVLMTVDLKLGRIVV